MAKTTIFNKIDFANKIKIALQELESETDTKLRSFMMSEAKSKVEGIDTISKKFHDVVKVTSNNGSEIPDFPEEIYTAVMKRIVAVEAPKISGGALNEGAIIQQLGSYIADLLDTKNETIKVGNTTYTMSNPFGTTNSTVTVTIKGKNNVQYIFSWNDDNATRKSLNSYMESLKDYEKENLTAVFFALLKDAKKASGVLKDLSSLWSKGLLSGKALDYASKMKDFEFFRVLSTYKKMYGESVFTLITGVVEEIKPLLEIYANTQTPNKKAKKLLDWYSKATGTVEGFIEWTEEIFSDNKKKIKNITKKYNSLFEKSVDLANFVTKYEGSDESLISALDKKASTYKNFIAAYNALETELGQSNTSFDSILEDYMSYSITDAHNESITDNNALVKGTNENDTLNIQSRDVKVYGGEGDDDFIASSRNITLIGEQGKDHFLLRDVTSKNYVDAGADNDTILSYGNNNTINGGSGNDSILVSVYYGFGIKNEIRGGEGQDTISVTAVMENTVLGEAGNDFIHISGEANNNTIIGGTGNDTITIDNADRNFIGYSMGDGNDTVLGFDSNDTLYIAEGDFSKSTIGSDVLVIVGDGSILLKDAAGKDSNVKKPLTFDDLFKDMQRNKVIFGTQQDDTLSTTGDGATVDAGDGNDLIYNYVGANAYIDGGEGNDSVQSNIDGITIDGGMGDDSIRNYASDGIIFGGAGNDSVSNSGSNIEINGGEGEDYIENWSHAVTIAGDEGSDSISNTVNFVTIDAGSGNDSVQNRGSSASINGSSGDDTILSHGSNVSVIGGTGDDFISLASVFISNSYSPDNLIVYNLRDGNDSIVGFNSAWTLQLISGTVDKINSDAKDVFMAIGNDTITLTDSFKLGSLSIVDENENKIILPIIEINGSEEKDSFSNRWDNAIIEGLADDDSINNSGSTVTIEGGNGNDTILSSGSNVSINAGVGDNRISNSGSQVNIKAGVGNNTIYSSGDNVSILSSEGNDSITNYGEFVTIDAGLGNDTVYSSGDSSVIDAGTGNDSILNNGSNVTINAGTGDDSILNNWNGKNVLFVYNVGDGSDFISGFRTTSTLQLISGTVDKISSDSKDIFLAIGNDTITLSGAFELGSINVIDEDGDKIELPGLEINATEEIKFIGNSWNNATINGVADDDSIRINNHGSDILINVEAGNDSVQNHGEFVTISSGVGSDTIHNWSGGNNASINSGDDNDYIENYGNSATISSGNGDDTVSNGYSWNNPNGGGSNTSISGGAGNDSIDNSYGSNATISGDAGNDTIHNGVGSTNTSINGGADNDTIWNNGESVTIDGGEGDDYIGNSGASSILDGYEGNDFLNISGDNISVSGGKGNDTITNGYFNKPYRRDGTSQKYLGGGKVIFQYIEGDGDDLIEGFNTLSTLSISGSSYSTQVSDFDIIVMVGNGKITLEDAAILSKININSDSTETTPSDTTPADTTPSDQEKYDPVQIVRDTTGINVNRLDSIVLSEPSSLNSTINDGTKLLNISSDTGVMNVDLRKFNYPQAVSLGSGNQSIQFNDANGNIAITDENATGRKNIVFGKGDDLGIFNSPYANVKVTVGSGYDSIVVDNNARVNVDMTKASDAIITANNSKVTLTNYDASSNAGILVSDVEDITNAIKDNSIQLVKDEIQLDSSTSVKISDNSNDSTIVNLITDDGDIQKVGFTGTNGGALDSSKLNGDFLLKGNYAESSSDKQGSHGSNIIAGKGDDTILAGARDTINGGSGHNQIFLTPYDLRENKSGATIVLSDKGRNTVQGFRAGFDSDSDCVKVNKVSDIKFDFKNDGLILSSGDSRLIFDGIGTSESEESEKISLLEGDSTVDATIAQTNQSISVDNDTVPDAFFGNRSALNFKDYNGNININLAEEKGTIDGTDSIVKGFNKLQAGDGRNTLIGSDSNETLIAGNGYTSIWGGAGNDKLFGKSSSENKDGFTTFFFNSGDDHDTIADFEFITQDNRDEGIADKIDIADNAVTDVYRSGSDVVLQINDSSDYLTIKDAYGKDFQINNLIAKVDRNITYDGLANYYVADGGSSLTTESSVDSAEIWLDNSHGTTFIGNIRTLDASAVEGETSLVGNANDNTIIAGKSDASLWGGSSTTDDLLIGGNSHNTFFYCNGNGHDTIQGINDGDIVILSDVFLNQIISTEITADSISINFIDGGYLKVDGRADVTYQLADGSKYFASHERLEWDSK